jgi:hypothetical protein
VQWGRYFWSLAIDEYHHRWRPLAPIACVHQPCLLSPPERNLLYPAHAGICHERWDATNAESQRKPRGAREDMVICLLSSNAVWKVMLPHVFPARKSSYARRNMNSSR